ncbi:DUF6896 domain-containing protein [Amycolatopsis suaedae]|uniref:DUF6896 domain-containing protein n=1 Tax=Amycolatopsis suaedae TaxID=2510978 RepID=A0A4Q7JEG5_9PSEU|nr:hypothetical protein [Amycolatopsis suaedae]RZQ65546.1 hypothetical protein EWH70_00120 [Amycolatopsis suaedae]
MADKRAGRLRDELDAAVAEFTGLAALLVAAFREHVEPLLEREQPYPDELDAGGSAWRLHVHGEHCRFERIGDGVVVEANTEHPGAVDPYFLLLYLRTSHRYPDLTAACPDGFRDMSRMLTSRARPGGAAAGRRRR